MLSSRLAIMTKGGKLACQGTTVQIKNDHGKAFHLDIDLNVDDVEEEIDITNVEILERKGQNPLKTEILN